MKKVALLLVFTVISFQASAGLVNPVIEGNKFSAEISLGGIEAELTIRFENAVGLNVDNLGISVELVDPLDLGLLARLPTATTLLSTSSLVSVPSAFPVLIRVDPPTSGGMAFEGIYEFEIYTRNLQYTVGSPLRLFTAPSANDPFHDVTDQISGGSYRTRTGGGHFSDFMILVDARAVEAVVAEKFDRLDDLLVEHASEFGALLGAQLNGLADAAWIAWNSGDPGAAIAHVDEFRRQVRLAAQAGDIPRVWRASRDIRNVEGELRSTARTLRFSLTLAVNLL